MHQYRFIVLAFIWLSFTQAEACDPRLLAKLAASEIPQIAREIEIKRTAPITALMTTKYGTLASAFPGGSVPSTLKMDFPQRTDDSILNMQWEELSPWQKERVLVHVSRGHDFDKSRAIPGFVIKDTIRILPRHNFTFLGKEYRAGQTYTVNLRPFLGQRIEYAATAAVPTASSVELHFRSHDNPSVLRREIESFFNNVLPSLEKDGGSATPISDHQHIPGKIPQSFFTQIQNEGLPRETGPALLTLYHQLAELAVLRANAENSISPFTVPNNLNPSKPPIMDYLDRESIPDIYNYFDSLSRGENPAIGISLKKNNVGVRGHDTYTDGNLWGLELRFAGYSVSGDAALQAISDGIRVSMGLQDFPIAHEPISHFVRENHGRVPEALADIWFRQSPTQLLESHRGYPSAELVKKAMEKQGHTSFEPTPHSVHSYHALLPILFMNWEKHPLVKYDPDLKTSVLKTQREYLERAIAGNLSSLPLVLGFLRDSGLGKKIDSIIKRPHVPSPASPTLNSPKGSEPVSRVTTSPYSLRPLETRDQGNLNQIFTDPVINRETGLNMGKHTAEMLLNDSSNLKIAGENWQLLNLAIQDSQSKEAIGLVQFGRKIAYRLPVYQGKESEQVAQVLFAFDFGQDGSKMNLIGKQIIDHAFKDLGLTRLVTRAPTSETRFQKSLEALGFVPLKSPESTMSADPMTYFELRHAAP